MQLRDDATQADRERYEVRPLAPARRGDGAGEVVLPIQRGRVTAEDVQGTIDHAGGLRFQARRSPGRRAHRPALHR